MAWANLMVLGIGGLLLTVPVILHLLMQPKPKQLMFPALRFVKERQHTNRSRMRLRHFLLLLLRCLLIALVALAFAGPRVASNEFGNWIVVGAIGFSAIVVAIILAAACFTGNVRNWTLISILGVILLGHLIYGGWSAAKLLSNESTQLLGDSGDPVAAIMLIDTSPRMSYMSENETRLEKAKEMGKWLISQLPLDSQVCALATDNDNPFFSVDVSAAKTRIDTFDIAYNSSSIPDALDEGLRMLEKAPEERKEIYIISDLTLASWSSGKGSAIADRLRENEGISVFLIDVGIKNPTNFSLSTPQLSSSAVTRNGGVKIASELTRLGPAAQRTVRMKLEKRKTLENGKLDLSRPQIRDGKTLVPDEFWERNVTADIRENGTSLVEFQFNEPLPVGVHHGQLELVGDDGLEADNIGYFTIEVRDAWKVLIVHPDDVYPDNLEFTLAPRQNMAPDESMFSFTTISQSDIDRPDFSEFQSIYLLDPAPLPNTTWGALAGFVESGGGLGIFLGHNAANGQEADESFGSENAVKLLGGLIDFPFRRPDGKLYLSPDNFSHPVFAPFRTYETGIPWYNHSVFTYWGIEPQENSEDFPTQTILKFGNGRPAIIEREIGQGRVITMLTPITDPGPVHKPSWNNLFLDEPLPWPMFWLLKEIAEYLVQSNADTLNISVGQVASLRNDRELFPREYRMFSPYEEGTTSLVTAPDDAIRYRFTDRPGQYRLKGVLDEPVVRGFSVNLPTDSTNLTRVDSDQLDLVLGSERYQMAVEQEQIRRQQGTTRNGKEFFPVLILLMVVLLGVENLMSNRFYQTR